MLKNNKNKSVNTHVSVNISSEMLLTVADTEHDSHCTNELICTNLHKACIRLGHLHFIMDGRRVHDAS